MSERTSANQLLGTYWFCKDCVGPSVLPLIQFWVQNNCGIDNSTYLERSWKFEISVVKGPGRLETSQLKDMTDVVFKHAMEGKILE